MRGFINMGLGEGSVGNIYKEGRGSGALWGEGGGACGVWKASRNQICYTL